MFNKIDLIADPVERKRLSVQYPDALFVSALSQENVTMVKGNIAEIIRTYKKEAAVANILAQKTKELNRDEDGVRRLPWEQK